MATLIRLLTLVAATEAGLTPCVYLCSCECPCTTGNECSTAYWPTSTTQFTTNSSFVVYQTVTAGPTYSLRFHVTTTAATTVIHNVSYGNEPNIQTCVCTTPACLAVQCTVGCFAIQWGGVDCPESSSSASPTPAPTFPPTTQPSFAPTRHPTSFPTSNPTRQPTFSPTSNPTSGPSTSAPTPSPVMVPAPTAAPTFPGTATTINLGGGSSTAAFDTVWIVVTLVAVICVLAILVWKVSHHRTGPVNDLDSPTLKKTTTTTTTPRMSQIDTDSDWDISSQDSSNPVFRIVDAATAIDHTRFRHGLRPGQTLETMSDQSIRSTNDPFYDIPSNMMGSSSSVSHAYLNPVVALQEQCPPPPPPPPPRNSQSSASSAASSSSAASEPPHPPSDQNPTDTIAAVKTENGFDIRLRPRGTRPPEEALYAYASAAADPPNAVYTMPEKEQERQPPPVADDDDDGNDVIVEHPAFEHEPTYDNDLTGQTELSESESDSDKPINNTEPDDDTTPSETVAADAYMTL